MSVHHLPRRALILSVLSKLACILALGYLAKKTWEHHQLFPSDTRLLLLLVAESFTIFLVVIARDVEQVMRKPLILGVTVVSSCYFILVDLERGILLIPFVYGRALQILGIFIELMAKAWIWRSFGLLPAHRGLVTSGPYRWVRHPMYLGYFVTHLGFLLCAFSLRNLILYVVLYVFVFYRIGKEEEFLKKDPKYRDYQGQVRRRLIPLVY